MSPDERRSFVLGLYEALNTRDFDRAALLYAEDAEIRNVATGEVFHGREGYLQYARAWAAAFPDGRTEVVRISGGEPAAAVEVIRRGTHTGALIGSHGHVPPTWAQIEIRGCDVLVLAGRAVQRLDSYLDTGTLLRQMGLLPKSPLHAPDRRAALDLYALESEASTQQRNKAVVRRFVDAVMNRHDPAAAADLCVPNLAWHGGPLGELRDITSFQRQAASLFASFPDLRVEIQDTIAEGDRVAARTTVTGTHQGEFQGIPPTGKRTSGAGASTYRVVDGRIVEVWWQHDLLSVLRQLDILPAIGKNAV